MIFCYSGYYEKNCDYSKKYNFTYGETTGSQIEIIKINRPDIRIKEVGVYSTKYKYRLKVNYCYVVDNELYKSYF